MAKKIIYELEARQSLAAGVSKLARAVVSTLGPRGRNAVLDKGWGAPKVTKAGNITIEQAIKVADMKKDSLMGKDLKNRVLEVVGTAVSCGISVEGKDPKDMQKEIKDGKWDAKLVK